MKLDKRIATIIGAIAGVVLIIAAVGFIYYHYFTQTSPTILREEGAISSLNSQVANLQSQLSAVSSQVSTLQNQLSLANSQISTLQNQLSSANSQISNLQTQILNLSQSPRGIWWLVYPGWH